MKKVLAIVLAALMVMALFAGCGSSKTTTTATTAPAATTAATAAASSAPAATAAATESGSGIPTIKDYTAGPVWDGTTQPDHTNGSWAQSYSVIDALAEQAKAYDSVSPKYTFTLACHDPAESAPGEFLTAWTNAVTIATKGAVDFTIGFSGALSGTMASLDDMKSGTIDFDWTLPCYFKGYMPLTNVIQNPALGIKNATSGSYAMWNLYKNSKDLQAEFADDGQLLFVWTNCTSPLSYKGDHEITSVKDIVGNIRANNGPAQLFVTQVGGSVFGCPITDVYTNVTTGVINYLVTDWHGIKSFSLYDQGVLNYYVDTNIGSSAYCLMANADTWASIPADIQEQINSVSGDYLLNLVSIWDYWEATGRYLAKSNGGDIFAPSDSFAKELDDAYTAVAKTWVSQQADPTVAQSLYDQAVKLVNQYNSEFDW